MTHFSTSIDIQAPPDRVWAVMRDVEHWGEWTPTVTSVERLDHGPLTVESRALIRQPKLRPAKWQVTELEEGRGFTWVSGIPGVRVAGRHWIEAIPSGSRATLSLEFSGILGPLVARILRNLNESYLTLEANGLNERSEQSK
jgi:uncharacterized membrane protein